MPFFAYKARNARGELVEGVTETTDADALAGQLFNSGITPIQITQTKQPTKTNTSTMWKRLREQKISSIDVQLFSRQLHTLLRSGVPIMRGLAGLQESATNRSFARLLQDLREMLDSGRELSAAMLRHPGVFSPFYISMVRVGEMTGRLEDVFLSLYAHLEFERDMRSRVKTALRYPMMVLIAISIAMVVINIFVIPAFAKVFDDFHAPLPILTRLLIGVSNFSVHYWYVILMSVVAAFIAIRSYLTTTDGRYKWDKRKLTLPIVGPIVLKGTLARFARSYAISSRSGVPIVQALHVVAQTVDNAFIAARIEQMRDGVERGDSILRTASVSGVFTPVVLQMIAVGEETGALDELMDEIGSMYESEVEYELKTLSSNIEPILITILGVMVLILALGIFLPIWDLGKVALRH